MSQYNDIFFDEYMDSISPMLSSSPIVTYTVIHKNDKFKPRCKNRLLMGFLIFIFICLITYFLNNVFKVNIFF